MAFISIRAIRMTSYRVFKQGRGRVVIFSVHQPSPRAFRAIDRVMLLGPGGKRLWCGAPRDAEGFFTAGGSALPRRKPVQPRSVFINLGAERGRRRAPRRRARRQSHLTRPRVQGRRLGVDAGGCQLPGSRRRVGRRAGGLRRTSQNLGAVLAVLDPPRPSPRRSLDRGGIAVSAPLVDHRDARAPRARGQDCRPGSDPPRRAPLSRPRHRRGARVALPKLP